MKRKYLISIEKLHLVAGWSLIVSGGLVYFIDGLEMALSWTIFGAMYISMSDVGENEMDAEKLNNRNHLIRRMFGYIGAFLGITLVFLYFSKLFLT